MGQSFGRYGGSLAAIRNDRQEDKQMTDDSPRPVRHTDRRDD